jgi:hypothetical protein
MQDIEKKLLPDDLRSAMESICEWSRENKRIDYDTFRRKYAELLLSKDPVDLTPWEQVAGNPYSRVDVIRNGKIVYTVPPLWRSQVTLMPDVYERSMSKVQLDFSKQYEIHPEASMKTIQNGISSRLNPGKVDLADLLNWNKILIDMGREPIDLSGFNVEESGQTPAGSNDLDIIVEEEDL